MHIVSLRLVNFARYEDEELTFHPGFNSIIGQSDAGKSSILRALIWVFYNRPSGMEMCREGGDETTVTLTTSEGVVVSRIRSKKRNAYELTDTSGTVVFDSVKTDVPLEISTALGIHFAELGKQLEMLNVSRQMDGPFMLASSGSDAAKILGNLSGVTTLDSALSTLKPDLTGARKELDAIEKLERAYASATLEYETLPREEELLTRAAAAVAAAQAASARLESLRDVRARMATYNDVINGADQVIGLCRARLAASEPTAAAVTLLKRVDDLNAVLTMMERWNVAEKDLTAQTRQAMIALADLHAAHTALLREAGTCPTCGARQ